MKYPNEFYENDFIPNVEDFTSSFMELNHDGNPDNARESCEQILLMHRGKATIEKQVVFTYGYLLDKYRKYLDYTDSKNVDKDEKYISKADKKQSPEDWLGSNGYNKFYEISKNSRDLYILSNLKPDTLRRKLKIFKSELKLTEKEETTYEKPITTTEKTFGGLSLGPNEDDTPF